MAAQVQGKSEARVFFDAQAQRWEFPEVLIFFHQGDLRPASPSFRYAFPDPPCVAEPAVLGVDEFYCTTNDQYALKVHSGDLKELPESIALTVAAVDDQSRPYRAKVVFRPAAGAPTSPPPPVQAKPSPVQPPAAEKPAQPVRQILSPARPPTRSPVADLSCPNCHSRVQPQWHHCPRCSTALDNARFCIKCGGRLRPDSSACPQCKAPVRFR